MFWLLPLPLDEPIFRFCSFLPEVARATSNRVLLCLFFATHQTYVCTRAPARGCLECPWPNTHTHNFYSTKLQVVRARPTPPLPHMLDTVRPTSQHPQSLHMHPDSGKKHIIFEHKIAVQSLGFPTQPLPHHSDTVRPTFQHPQNLHMCPDPAGGGGGGGAGGIRDKKHDPIFVQQKTAVQG